MVHHLALSVRAWLLADPENVAALHCKAGKGRTGVMCVAVLCMLDAQNDAAAAMELFESGRTSPEAFAKGVREGVKNATQQANVRRYQELLRSGRTRELLVPPRLRCFGLRCNDL